MILILQISTGKQIIALEKKVSQFQSNEEEIIAKNTQIVNLERNCKGLEDVFQ